MFPELRRYLTEASEVAQDRSEYVVTSYRDASANLRTQFERIIAKSKHEPWERLFQNLRASRQTALENEFKPATVCNWLGNSEQISRTHYSMTTEAEFDRAVGATAGAIEPLGANWGAETNGSQVNPNARNPEENAVCASTSGFPILSGTP